MDNPLVREEVKKILRFWLDMGVDGFREDVITYISKKEGLPDDHLFPIYKGMPNYNHGPHIHEYLAEFTHVYDDKKPLFFCGLGVIFNKNSLKIGEKYRKNQNNYESIYAGGFVSWKSAVEVDRKRARA